jgi:tetratricopeptide (TPR) repeat protein
MRKPHGNLRLAYRDMGKYDLSLEEWKKSSTLFNDREDLAIAEDVARVYARSGVKASLAREIELKKQLAKRRYVDPTDIAYAYAALGDKDQTFAWLDKALAEKSEGLQIVKIVRPLEHKRISTFHGYRNMWRGYLKPHGEIALRDFRTVDGERILETILPGQAT